MKEGAQRLLSKVDIADACGVKVVTVDSWIQRGKLPKPDVRTSSKIARWTPTENLKAFIETYQNKQFIRGETNAKPNLT